jgi:hypothetical protein
MTTLTYQPYNEQLSGNWQLSGSGKKTQAFSYIMEVKILPNSTFTTKQLSNIGVLKGACEICFNNGTNNWTSSYDNITNENQGQIININGK